MRQSLVLTLLALGSLHFLISPAASQDLFSAQVFHESLGDVIDAQENSQFHIFTDVDGFTAAKIYSTNGENYQLHLLRNSNENAQILILKLPLQTFVLLRTQISNRINWVVDGKSVEQPVYAIDEAKWAQSSATKLLNLRDGSQLYVTLQRARLDTLLVKTVGGIEISVPDSHIADVSDAPGQIVEGNFYRLDPNTSRLFFAPTGRRLEAKSGYLADYYVFLPTLAFGVSNMLSLSGGVSLLPGADSQIFYFAPKLTWEVSQKVGLAAGFLSMSIPNDTNNLHVNLAYSVATYGDALKSITVGAGIPFGADSNGYAVLLIGGESQVSNSVKLITENWIFAGEVTTAAFSGGVRFFGERLAVDLALITVKDLVEEGGFPFIPWVDFSVFFNNK